MPWPSISAIDATRVVVRGITEADLRDLLAINGDDAVTQFLPYATWQSLDDGAAWLARMQALADAGSGQQLVIERRADGRVIGSVLLFKFDEGSARIELGYVLGREHWRQGYAKEALHAVCGHAFAQMGVRRIEAEVNPANVASSALLLSLGFTHEGLLRQRWVAKGVVYDTFIFGCLASDWPVA